MLATSPAEADTSGSAKAAAASGTDSLQDAQMKGASAIDGSSCSLPATQFLFELNSTRDGTALRVISVQRPGGVVDASIRTA